MKKRSRANVRTAMLALKRRRRKGSGPPEWLREAYPGLHDLDLDLAVQKVAA